MTTEQLNNLQRFVTATHQLNLDYQNDVIQSVIQQLQKGHLDSADLKDLPGQDKYIRGWYEGAMDVLTKVQAMCKEKP